MDEKGDKWVRSKEIANHPGYANEDAIHVIYNRHRGFFIEGKDSVTIKLIATDGKEYETRVFSFIAIAKDSIYGKAA